MHYDLQKTTITDFRETGSYSMEKMSSGSGGVLEFTPLSQEVFRSEAKVGTRIGAWEQN